ncbi:Nin one binding Zn-ribbon like-domain-containing protein [Colletotrichum godetiae]|uniref:20S-pre-rRNA D-site endonuclease NOB1 n=1 Tax=Colletotrichum godetiae TaxID=1209918 RepID=A0AAJ0AF66_9PEZI|nr:Nin one binding Zn-ribbon like-domain-containing protein [Colletotrichum godetiae]KAK1671353.1 Nin one binding Zn-ribbon like-domain-containing protein [Colletotrichum godetiae]
MSNDAVAAPAVASPAVVEARKPIHALVLDTGPLIKNDPPVSTLLAQADELYMLPSIVDEIRDVSTRTRVQTTLMPFVKLRNPRPDSIKFVSDFARRSGDLEVLSRPDLHLLALTYELELEKTGGDKNLRKQPGARTSNDKVPSADAPVPEAEVGTEPQEEPAIESAEVVESTSIEQSVEEIQTLTQQSATVEASPLDAETTQITQDMSNLEVDDKTTSEPALSSVAGANEAQGEESDSEDGWITPSNVKKQKEKDSKLLQPTAPAIDVKVGILTSDYAMQNVALRIGLNLLSPSMSRITQLKTWVLRCHGCFQVCKKMDRQFCPSCGQATLIRTSCTTEEDGTFKIHLKRNFQWNNRGNVFSIPKPSAGTASGKLSKNAGGKNNWGTNLIFAEDQKEYERAMGDKHRARRRDLMDEDYLPSILTGDRQSGANGKVRLGPGRNINGRRRR